MPLRGSNEEDRWTYKEPTMSYFGIKRIHQSFHLDEKDEKIHQLEAKVDLLLEHIKRIQKQERIEEGIYEQLDLFEYIA